MSKKIIVAPESKTQKVIEVGDHIEQNLEIDRMTPSHRRALQKYETKQEFIYPLERITQSKLFIMKVKFPGSDEAYPLPTQAMFRFVSKFYPYAAGGALYVDEPVNELEIHRAYERQKVMKRLHLRYLIVERDSTYDMLLEQLGEL